MTASLRLIASGWPVESDCRASAAIRRAVAESVHLFHLFLGYRGHWQTNLIYLISLDFGIGPVFGSCQQRFESLEIGRICVLGGHSLSCYGRRGNQVAIGTESNRFSERLIPLKAERVLIYRLGSLGDTVVALPALHLVARAFPNAERVMLMAVSAEPHPISRATVWRLRLMRKASWVIADSQNTRKDVERLV
jgi:hypothetical protein